MCKTYIYNLIIFNLLNYRSSNENVQTQEVKEEPMELVVNKPEIVYPENTRTTAINTG